MRYLTEEWVDALDAAAQRSERLRALTAGVRLVVQHVIGKPADGVAFHVAIDDGEVRFRWGRAESPTVTFTEDAETARLVATGAQSAQAAFLAGRMCVEGDLAAVVRHGGALAGIDDELAEVRAAVEW